jgi:hypothetical protein
MANPNNLKFLVRGYSSLVGFRYWYASSASLPFDEYPGTDPFYPPITPTNPYSDVVIYDIPRGGGGSGDVDGYVTFSGINTPSIGDLVFVNSFGEAELALGHTSISSPTQMNVVGVAVSADRVRSISVAPQVNVEVAVTPGEILYLSATTAGKATPSAPFSTDQVMVPIGIALTADSGGSCAVMLNIGTPTFIS